MRDTIAKVLSPGTTWVIDKVAFRHVRAVESSRTSIAAPQYLTRTPFHARNSRLNTMSAYFDVFHINTLPFQCNGSHSVKFSVYWKTCYLDPSVSLHIYRIACLKMPPRQKRQQSREGGSQAKATTKPAPATPANPQRLIIGVDFGTTFTSVAYVRTKVTQWLDVHSLRSFKDEVIPVRRWPDTSDQNQLPTTLLYDKSNPTTPHFGYGVDYALDFCRLQDPSPVLRLFKLLLHRSQETQEERAKLEQIVREFDKNPVDLIEDFLARLRAYLLDGPESFFRTTYGSRPDKEGWKIEWALGIPAAWQNPQEQQMYVDAARRAGITSPALISEPEATASVFFAENDEPLEVSARPSVLGSFV
jgi:hypothetical protein